MREECRGETAHSGRAAAGAGRVELARAACTAAGTDKHTGLEPAVELGAAEVVAGVPRELEVVAAAASSGRPGATAPMLPSLPAAVGREPARRAEPEHKRLELRTERERPAAGAAEVRRLLPAEENWNTAEAILRSCY
jgi:hypothetical protein